MPNDHVIAQHDLVAIILPEILKSNIRYQKFLPVHARKAIKGEEVISMTSAGYETTNTADSDQQWVIKNLTNAKELYLINAATFKERYEFIKKLDETWSQYRPLGSVMAIPVTEKVLAMLNVTGNFRIIALWGTEQTVNLNDMFVSPLPALNEIYRVDITEFKQTYTLV